MAVRDGAAHVAEAVEGILAQTFTDFELVVLDDGSTDDTTEILARLSDPRLVVVRNEENLGLTRSLNRGLALAHGEYVARHDADDRSRPERLERQVALLEASRDVVLCGTWAVLTDREGRPLGTFAPPSGGSELARLLPTANQFVHGALLFRRRPIEELGCYRAAFRYAQDYDLVLRASERHRLANVPQPLYELRLHPGAIGFARAALQQRYVALAQQLARERRAGVPDALERGVDIADLLASVPAPPADLLSPLVRYFWRVGDVRAYRRALLALAREQPARAGLYARLLLSFVPRPMLERARHVLRDVQ
jgi:glycosyltransferase involved in cell wall biosynthesis